LENLLYNLAIQFGFIGVFLVSLIGASSIVFPIPYTVVIFWLSANTNLNPIFLMISAGVGSALGEIVGYTVGYAAKGVVGEKTRRKFDAMLKVLMKHKNIWPLLIFLFAFTPLPDDLIFVPLGLARFNFFRVFFPCLMGKLAMFYVIIMGGRYTGSLIRSFTEEISPFLSLTLTLVTAILLGLIVFLIWRIDWEKFLAKHNKVFEVSAS
jgi:membrane protein YqaA with SNARE-associated domain